MPKKISTTENHQIAEGVNSSELLTGWRKVEDELPEINSIVLICYKSDYNGKYVYAFGGRQNDGEYWLWGVTDTYWGIYYNEENPTFEVDDDYNVTHWMPLPIPPSC